MAHKPGTLRWDTLRQVLWKVLDWARRWLCTDACLMVLYSLYHILPPWEPETTAVHVQPYQEV